MPHNRTKTALKQRLVLLNLKQLGKPLTIQFGVAHRARDRPVSQVALNNSDIGAFVNQGITATVPEHMRVNLQMLQASSSSCLSEHEPDGNA